MSLVSKYIIFIFILIISLNCESKRTKKVKSRKEDNNKFKVVTVSDFSENNISSSENLIVINYIQENKGTVNRPFYLLSYCGDDHDHFQNLDGGSPLLQGNLQGAKADPMSISQNRSRLSI